MDIAPRTDREKLLVEAAHMQGFADGVQAAMAKMKELRIKALLRLEDSTENTK